MSILMKWKNKKEKMEYLSNLINTPLLDATTYSKFGNHETGDFVSHQKFGLGFIQKVISNTRIEVFFNDSEKILLQNWQSS